MLPEDAVSSYPEAVGLEATIAEKVSKTASVYATEDGATTCDVSGPFIMVEREWLRWL